MNLVASPIHSDGSGLFDLVLGLPMHPLVVHFAVVLLPLTATALIAIILIPKARRPFGWIVMAGLVISVGASLLAKETGEALAARVGWPTDHAYWGGLLPWLALSLAIIGGAWFWMQRIAAQRQQTSWLARLIGACAIVVALGSILMTVVVGHSGAVAVWTGRIQPTTTTSSSATPVQPSGGGNLFTMDVVARHSSSNDCWTVVQGTVYDLTTWIGQHPGGAVPSSPCAASMPPTHSSASTAGNKHP